MTKADPTISTVPVGYSSVSPWIISRNTNALFTFMTKAFGAKEIYRSVSPGSFPVTLPASLISSRRHSVHRRPSACRWKGGSIGSPVRRS